MKGFKGFIYGLVITVMLCGSVIAVQETMVGPAATFTSSGLKTGSIYNEAASRSMTIVSGGGIGAFAGIVMNGDGTNNHTMTIYDSTAASSGTVLFKGTCTNTAYTCTFAFPWPIAFNNGIVAYTNAGTPSFVIYYDNRGR
jgi:hypothetical protein